jgi:tetratricopeptide (TPR) repeat protein
MPNFRVATLPAPTAIPQANEADAHRRDLHTIDAHELETDELMQTKSCALALAAVLLAAFSSGSLVADPPQRAAAPPASAQPAGTQSATKPTTQQPTPSTDLLAPVIAQAQEALDRKDYDTTLTLLQKIIAQRPDEPLPHFELGYVYSVLKRNDEAAAEYRHAIALNSALVEAHLNLGLVLLESDPNAAAESFRRAAALVPNQGRPHYLAGEALERADKPADAIAEYTAGLALAPRDQPMKFALARALLAAGRASEAESQFRETIALDPGSASGAPSDASAPASPQNFTTPAKLGLAETLLRENKAAESVDAFAVYLAAAPDDRMARFERSVALQDLGRLDDALAELDRADLGGRPTTDSLKLRGSICMQQRNWTAATAALQKAIAMSPDDAELHAWQGHTQLELRNYGPAENELKRSLTLDPKPPEVLGDLVNVYFLSERYAEALASLDLLATRQTRTAINWFFRAVCCDKLKKQAEAASAYQKFLDLDQGSHADQDFQARQRIKALQQDLKRR